MDTRGGTTILHIEDIDAVRRIVRIILAKEGYTVLGAGTLAEANAVWAQHRSEIDLIVSDNALPDGSGVELVKKLEAEKPGLSIIVTSGLPHDDLPTRYYQLSKPFNAQFLLGFVRGALREQANGGGE